MKKVFLTLTILIISASAFAQFSQGTMMVGGSAGFEFNKEKYKDDGNSSERERTTTLHIEPQFGIFVIDQLALGAGVSESFTRSKLDFLDGERISTSTRLTFEPFIRYYLPQRVFFQGKFLIGGGSVETEIGANSERNRFTTTGLALSAGYSIKLNESIAIEPQLGYESTGLKFEDADGKNIDNNFYLRIGVQAYLNR